MRTNLKADGLAADVTEERDLDLPDPEDEPFLGVASAGPVNHLVSEYLSNHPVERRRGYESVQLEIIMVLEALGQLRESPEYELCQIIEKKPGVLDELATERASQLEKESAELEKQAQRLAAEIEELAGETPVRIG